jgi:hypothetical protein
MIEKQATLLLDLAFLENEYHQLSAKDVTVLLDRLHSLYPD